MNGLLLIGGKSSRMGTDKASLTLRDGMTQTERGIALLSAVCDQVFLSVSDDAKASEANTIVDSFGNIGPLGAIASAQKAQPDATWLVLACDLPMLEAEHLQALTHARTTDSAAVYYSSAIDQQPEPLCTIWEPSSADAVTTAISQQKYCPRNVLSQLQGTSLPSPDLWTLANTNTPADLIEIKARLANNLSQKTITLSYFAQLRELTGTSSETHTTESLTPAGVFEEIRAKHNISLKRKAMMVAVNGDFTDWTHPLSDGEELVFIPPVAGG